MKKSREVLILRTWVGRGKAEWGKGAGPVTIDLPAVMKAPKRAQSLPAPDSLKYELWTSKVKGKLVNQIVCEGVVVETYELAQER
jgi:hypothetical protein